PVAVHPLVAHGAADQPVLVEQFRQHGAYFRLGPLAILIVAFRVAAVADRLTQQGVGLVLAGVIQKRPGSPRQDRAVPVHLILYGVLEVIVGLADRPPGQGGKGLLGSVVIGLAGRFAQHLAAAGFLGHIARGHGVKDLAFAAAFFLNAVGVAVQ